VLLKRIYFLPLVLVEVVTYSVAVVRLKVDIETRRVRVHQPGSTFLAMACFDVSILDVDVRGSLRYYLRRTGIYRRTGSREFQQANNIPDAIRFPEIMVPDASSVSCRSLIAFWLFSSVICGWELPRFVTNLSVGLGTSEIKRSTYLEATNEIRRSK
jgi:hypothetical protein